MLIPFIQNKNLKWYIATPVLVLTGFQTIISLYEYVNVGLLGHTDGYPWGTEGPIAWYYETPQLYVRQMLISGLLSLVLLVLAMWLTIKEKIVGLIILTILSATYSIIQYLNYHLS